MQASTRDGHGIFIGTAGWALPKAHRAASPASGTLLQRYAARLRGVEINSSFYRPHRASTYAKWAASVPAAFRFAVKVPKAMTHGRRLQGCEDLIARFADEVAGLGARRGPLLVQLPPSLPFDAAVAAAFLAGLAARTGAALVCEPRHASWFTPEAESLLVAHGVARVAADPALAPGAAEPGGWPGQRYWRLHGTPRPYYSDYDEGALARMAQRLHTAAQSGATAWCVFDNTALGHALGNALAVERLAAAPGSPA